MFEFISYYDNYLKNFRIITNEIDGLRIVDMSYIFFQIQNIKHDGGFDCNFINMNRSGFYSDFLFKCKMCNLEKKISSTKIVPDSNWSINKAAVSSSIAIGK